MDVLTLILVGLICGWLGYGLRDVQKERKQVEHTSGAGYDADGYLDEYPGLTDSEQMRAVKLLGDCKFL
jgi:hypothetical protein